MTDRTPHLVSPQRVWTPTSTGDSAVYALDCDRFVAVRLDSLTRAAHYLPLTT